MIFETNSTANKVLVLLAVLMIAAPIVVLGAPDTQGDCSSEPSLAGRNDVVLCEPWENSNWWQDGYLSSARLENPIPASADNMNRASIVNTGCISGSCLKIDMLQYEKRGLALHWPTSKAGIAPEQMYLRYYIKLGPAWTTEQCNADTGTRSGTGGKFPGLADVRTNSDPGGQCGNGGARGNGIDCWSARSNFRNCRSGDDNACSTVPNATTRFGSYLYFYGQGSATGSHGFWDDDNWGQSGGGAVRCDTPSDVYCGIDDGGVFVNSRWYLVETIIKMNTPDQADGIVRGWVDGQLSYEKTDMIFRLPGHDNLHVRTIWLDVYKGGTKGNCVSSEIYLDQMVATTDARPGPWGGVADNVAPAAPTELTSDP